MKVECLILKSFRVDHRILKDQIKAMRKNMQRRLKRILILILEHKWPEVRYAFFRALGLLDLSIVEVESLNLSGEQANRHESSGGFQLENILGSLEIKSEDKIVDLGCGKGGAIISIAKFPFSQISGVEISPLLVAIANRNIKLVGIRNVEIFCCDARAFHDLDKYNYIFLFNPFPSDVIVEVIENIKGSLKRRHRVLNMIYVNPICHDMIKSSRVFHHFWNVEHPWYKLGVMIYKSQEWD
jgi:SAM-dependent methyltransferase